MNKQTSPSMDCDWSADNSWSLSDESAETNIDSQQWRKSQQRVIVFQYKHAQTNSVQTGSRHNEVPHTHSPSCRAFTMYLVRILTFRADTTWTAHTHTHTVKSNRQKYTAWISFSFSTALLGQPTDTSNFRLQIFPTTKPVAASCWHTDLTRRLVPAEVERWSQTSPHRYGQCGQQTQLEQCLEAPVTMETWSTVSF